MLKIIAFNRFLINFRIMEMAENVPAVEETTGIKFDGFMILSK